MNGVTATLVAHLMGDGCVASKYIRYNNKNEYLLEKFKADMKKEFGESIHFTEGKVNSGTKFVQIHKRSVLRFFTDIAPTYKSGDITIPEAIVYGSEDVKASFIKAFFDDEGSVGIRKRKTGDFTREIHAASKSRKIMEQMRYMLESDFQIKCNKLGEDTRARDNKVFTTWILRITGKDNLAKFQEKINFDHPDKKEKLHDLLVSYVTAPLRES